MPAAASAAATSSTSLSGTAPAATRPWKVELYHSTETAVTSVTKKEGISTTVNYVGFKSKVLNGKSLGIRQLFMADYMSDDNKSDVRMGNTYIHLTDPKLFAMANGIEGTGIVRLYLPTGEDNRFVNKQNGALRLYLITAKSMGKWDFDMTLIGQAYSNSQDTFVDRTGATKSNAEYYGYPSLNAGYNISDTLSLGQSFGVENIWYRTKAPIRSFNSTTTVSWKAMPQLTLNGNLSNDINVANPKQDFAMGREEEMSLLFEAAVAL